MPCSTCEGEAVPLVCACSGAFLERGHGGWKCYLSSIGAVVALRGGSLFNLLWHSCRPAKLERFRGPGKAKGGFGQHVLSLRFQRFPGGGGCSLLLVLRVMGHYICDLGQY